VSQFSLATLGSTSTRPNLEDYVAKFSANARQVFEHFEFDKWLEKLEKANLLYRFRPHHRRRHRPDRPQGSRMKTKPILAAVAVASASVGGYWYYSPYLVLNDMREAAQRKDADAFNERVDYPRLRESMKGQMSAVMAESAAASSNNGFAAFGAMLGMALVNQMVEALVRPESVMRAMQSGDMEQGSASTHPGTQSEANKKPVEWSLERKNVDKIIAYRQVSGKEVDKDVGLVFERNGFADWKLTEIRLGKLR
jgi:hypothetical protein